MTINLNTVQALAPDQASLKAAQKLLSGKKWPVKERSEKLIWGNCQGSGANPYLVVFDLENHGYKCSCPSRKFPCKHVLALAWIFTTSETDFASNSEPQWILDWQSRRHPTTKKPATEEGEERQNNNKRKNIYAAMKVKEPPPVDPKKQAAAEKRAAKNRAATDAAISASLLEWQQWLNDQLRFGLVDFLENGEVRCRQIAARLVDGKASALASRLDELPARWAGLPPELQLRYAISELGKIACLVKMWQKNPTHPDVRRAITNAENRAAVLENPDAPRQKGLWQVIGEQIEARRDNMISHATWFRCLDDSAAHPFALLLDFYPRSTGSREQVRLIGEIFQLEMVFYPSVAPLRGFIAEQQPADSALLASESTKISKPITAEDFFRRYREQLIQVPWLLEMPFLLPAGRIVTTKNGQDWWQAENQDWALPIRLPEIDRNKINKIDLRRSCQFLNTFIIWDGVRATFGSAQTADWGILSA